MTEDYIDRTVKILQRIIYATVATTSADSAPWNSPVRHVYDQDLNIYWFSDKESQHSKNIRANQNVFIVIYDSTVTEGNGEGLFLKAKAHEVNETSEILHARQLKKGIDLDTINDFTGNAARRVYKAVPEQAWTNVDDIKDNVFIRDYRVELSLEDIKRKLAA